MTASRWGGRFRAPVFVFTADQDWASPWALDVLLGETVGRSVPLHLFVTDDHDAVRQPPDGLTLGIHPNFLPGSTHGSSPSEVIEHCLRLVPGATTFRCHSFFEYTGLLADLWGRGLRTDSNLGLFGQPGLEPLMHCTGLIRLPVFFEDDVFIHYAGPDLLLGPLREALFAPGLKVINVHPTLVAANVPNPAFYRAHKQALFGPQDESKRIVFRGRGTRTVLTELIDLVRAVGGEVAHLPELAAECHGWLDSPSCGQLYQWRRKSLLDESTAHA